MSKTVLLALAMACVYALAPVAPAFAFSSEAAPTNSDGSSQIADPDEQLDDIASPGSGTDGSVTMEEPSTGTSDSGTNAPASQSQLSTMIAPAPSGSGN